METEQMTETKQDGDKDVKKADARENWSGKLDFVMSALSLAVGMGNVWRFPYMCYRNGGGAFLIPYLIMVVLAGLPLMFLEFAFGQYGSSGIVTIWKIAPLFEGIGWAMNVFTFSCGVYYNMLLAYALYYIFASFTKDLPWVNCGNSWNTKYCASAECIKGNVTRSGAACPNRGNDTSLLKSPAEEYFQRNVLGVTSGLTDFGGIRWHNTLCYLLAWFVIILCLSKGIKSAGKAAHVTALLPYVLLTILFFRAITLEGSGDGIRYFITPSWDRMMQAKVWGDALVQVFYSLSLCMGGLITLASYNKFNNNCLRDAIVVAMGDTLTSIYIGFVIFAILGYMAHELGTTVDNVVSQGAGLAFIVYPSAITRLPISSFWSIVFMLMLFNLGLGTMNGFVTTIHTTILDLFPNELRRGYRPFVLLVTICFISFLMGLVMATDGGMYVLQLMDSYVASYGLLLCGVVETVVLCWVYGLDRLFDNVEEMTGYRLGKLSYYTTKFVSPTLIMAIVIVQFSGFKRLVYGNYTYPLWADILGWLFVAFEMAFIPGIAIYKVFRMKSELPLIQKFKSLCHPADDWGKRENPPDGSANSHTNQVDPMDSGQQEGILKTNVSDDLFLSTASPSPTAVETVEDPTTTETTSPPMALV